MDDCVKCGIRVNPPTLVVFYKKGEKIRKKTMPIRQFKAESNCTFLAGELKKRHNIAVPQLKIEKMLRILQEMLKGTEKEQAIKLVEESFTKLSHGNLNKLTTEELELQKQEMDVLFTKNQIKKEESNFEYDKQVEFDHQQGDSMWDEEIDRAEDFWESAAN